LNNEPSNEPNNAQNKPNNEPLVLEDFNLTEGDFKGGKLLKRKTKKSHYKRKRTNKRNQK
jgi:hypothetical protein